MSTTIQTKYGTARLRKDGYYYISASSTGHSNKLLHRCIFEDFYNINLKEEFPESIHIHHVDGDKTNNEIWNLIPISHGEHAALHRKGKKMSEENKKALSKANKGRKLTDEHKHKLSISHLGNVRSNEEKKKISKTTTSTGFFRVFKAKNKNYKQGFYWIYQYYPKGSKVQKPISSTNLLKLKDKVLKKGLEWCIVSKDIAEKVCVQYGYELKELC